MLLVYIFVHWIAKEVFAVIGLAAIMIGGIFVGPWEMEDNTDVIYFGALTVQGGAAFIHLSSAPAFIRCIVTSVYAEKYIDVEKAELSQICYLIFLTLGMIFSEVPIILRAYTSLSTTYSIISFCSAVILALYIIHWCYIRRSYEPEPQTNLETGATIEVLATQEPLKSETDPLIPS